mmetsp:Transcript_39302/g.85485  ORF Transcript_39302/g.85485 Transcript_39302/m.85485 type:complete len:88 (+) Transcript_39302:393-656(+)
MSSPEGFCVYCVQVLKSLTSGIIINIVGLAATLFGLEATTGLLFAKSLSATFAVANPYAMNQVNPVQALDIFVVQVRISCAVHLHRL